MRNSFAFAPDAVDCSSLYSVYVFFFYFVFVLLVCTVACIFMDDVFFGMQTSYGIELLKKYGTQIFMDSTHCTTRSETEAPHDSEQVRQEHAPRSQLTDRQKDRQLYNIMVADTDDHGIVVLSFYIDRRDAETLITALEWIKKQLLVQGIEWVVAEAFMDDDAAEHLSIKTVWPEARQQLCIWHVTERNARAKLTGLVGLDAACKVCELVWKLVRRGGHRDDRTPKDIINAAVDTAYNFVGCPAVDVGSPLHPDNVKRRLETGRLLSTCWLMLFIACRSLALQCSIFIISRAWRWWGMLLLFIVRRATLFRRTTAPSRC